MFVDSVPLPDFHQNILWARRMGFTMIFMLVPDSENSISPSEQLVRAMRLQKNETGGNLHPVGGVLMMERGNSIFVKLNNAE